MPKDNDLNNTEDLLKSLTLEAKKANPAAELISSPLSTRMLYLRDSPYAADTITKSERYVRSDKHSLKQEKQPFYPNKDQEKYLKNGGKAHLGAYVNVMQSMGDEYAIGPKRTITSKGEPALYNQLLQYKLDLCKYVQEKTSSTKYLKVIFANDFPCIMVHVTLSSIRKPNDAPELSEASHKAWVEYLISMFVGMINYYAYQANIAIELERRPSFGFLTPTICETGESFRISPGIVPREYWDLLVKTLLNLEALIVRLKKIRVKLPTDLFYATEKHEKYLGSKALSLTDNLIHLLFVPIETRSGLGVRHITRTAYARQALSINVFNRLVEGGEPSNAFAKALNWAVNKIEIKEKNVIKNGEKAQEYSLEFNPKRGSVAYSKKFPAANGKLEDAKFWETVQSILDGVKKADDDNINQQVELIASENVKPKNLHKLYFNLELLNELVFATSILQTANEPEDDGHGSDSECEEEIQEEKIFAKKLITHNGMRAIWAALLSACNHLDQSKSNIKVYIKTAYYEVASGLDLLLKLHGLKNVSIVASPTVANILIHDLNACVTDGKIKPDYTITNNNKILILDITSATTAQVNRHVTRFAESRAVLQFLVDSGFKNQQLGADKNQYGTVRVLAKDKKLTEKAYEYIVKNELGVFSMTSHVYRRKMKEIGAVPTTRRLILG